MPASDPFTPLSRKKMIGYAIGGVVIVTTAAILLGSMDGGFSAWQLLRVMGVVGIPAFATLGLVVWLSGGRRSEAGMGPANLKVPVRLLKALPIIVVAILLFYLMKTLEVFASP